MYNSDRTVQKRIGKILLPSMHTNSEVKNSDTMTAGALVMADLGVFKINVGVDWMFGKKYNGWLVKLNMRLSI